jgi:inosine-uridine nucleoside N-ribohydrolase
VSGEARVYDLDIGNDPDDTCVAAMIARSPERFRPALLITNDEARSLGRARFLAAVMGGARIPIAAGLPSLRRREDTLVERAALVPPSGGVGVDGVDRLIDVLERHDRTTYFGLGALTNLAAAIARRPDLAARVDLVQMGPVIEPREKPQYNARLDPASFRATLAAVRAPRLLLSDVSWARFGGRREARHEVGLYPDDPLYQALARAGDLALGWVVRHLDAWVASGKPCSILHDPLTVLSALEADLVSYDEVALVLDEHGHAALAPAPGIPVCVRASSRVDYPAARRAIVRAFFPDESATWADALADRWGAHNAERAEPHRPA